MSSSIRFCVINTSGSRVTVRLQAQNALRAGANLKIFNTKTSKIIENWNMKAGDSGSSDYLINTEADKLKGLGLSWEVISCSLIPQIEKGIIEFSILQDGVSCPVTKPMQWKLSDVPQCSSNKQVKFPGSLLFINDPSI